MINQNAVRWWVTMTVLFVILLMSFSTPALAGGCEEALGKCLIDAAIATVMGGVAAGGGYASWCFGGYAWCLEYLE